MFQSLAIDNHYIKKVVELNREPPSNAWIWFHKSEKILILSVGLPSAKVFQLSKAGIITFEVTCLFTRASGPRLPLLNLLLVTRGYTVVWKATVPLREAR